MSDIVLGFKVRTYVQGFGSDLFFDGEQWQDDSGAIDMNREDPAIPPGWEQVPDEETITAGHMYWHPWRMQWCDYDRSYGICTAGDYKKHGSIVIRKKESTQ